MYSLKHFIKNNFTLIITSSFIFALFLYITMSSPLVGDAYNYALRGSETNPFLLASLAYNSWSGRFFSELWGFLMCPHVELWNFLNPLFFTIIYISIVKLVGHNKIKLRDCLFVILLMLSVESHIRMQTYTWIMGTTYIIPLMLSLIYFNLVKDRLICGNKRIYYFLTNFILFYCGLTMENIAGTLILAVILLLGYSFYKNKKLDKALALNFIIIIISFIILRFSPGAIGRLAEYHPEWVAMSFFEQIIFNIKNFVILTFTNNQAVLFMLSLILFILMFQKRKHIQWNWIDRLSLLVYGLAFLFYVNIQFTENLFIQGMTWITWSYLLFWIIYVVLTFRLIWKFSCKKEEVLFFIILGGASSVCMMISPIFASRSLLYFVYFLIVSIMLLSKEVEINKYNLAMNGIFLLCISLFSIHYYQIYSLVSRIQSERESIIEYYRENPNEEEAWIPRMPDYTIHSGNIEEDNEYHMKGFKDYYGLNPNMKVIFYNEADNK